MQSMLVVAGNTFRETLRDKILYNIVLFALLLIGASVLIGTLTIGEQARIINDLGLSAISLVSVIIGIFVGIGLVSKEIDRRTIYTILARPIARYQFVLGKYLGLTFIVSVNLAIMFGMFLATVAMSGNPISGALFQAVGLILVETLLMMAVAMFFSTFSSSTLSAIFTIGLYIIGHLTSDMKAIASKSQNPWTESVITAVYYVCPNLEYLNIKGQAASGALVDIGAVALAAAYGLLYAGLVLTGASQVFQRRDF